MPALGTLPTLFPVLRDRKFALVLGSTALASFALLAIGLPGWQCPLLHFTGIPCPGCGLTRATYLMLHGELGKSLTLHAFAPMVLVGLLLIGLAGLLPEGTRQVWIDKLVFIEQRSGVVLILLTALILYWLARLVFMNSAFVQLIRS